MKIKNRTNLKTKKEEIIIKAKWTVDAGFNNRNKTHVIGLMDEGRIKNDN